MKRITRKLMTVTALAGAIGAGEAGAAEYWLCAASTVKTMPDGAAVTMWGYARDDNDDLSDGCGAAPVQVPGPELQVPPGDGQLTVHLRNDLPGAVATSLLVPTLEGGISPVYNADGRVRSFAPETGPAQIGTYSWTGVRPGSHIYRSGTHPAVQVQMGLYGPMVHDTASGNAYPGVPYDREVKLFYSEIDPALHQAVTDGSYGSAAYPSTLDYQARYFLVNGEPWQSGTPPVPAGVPGERLLLRLFNMGLESHVPVAQGLELELVAEDARPYPHPRRQYSAELAAGKSRDAVVVAPRSGQYAIYDRALGLTNGSAPGTGGLLSLLAVTDGALPGQLGAAAVTHEWQTVALSGATPPVVIAGPPGANGSQAGVVRIRNVEAAGFQARFAEWEYLDGWHLAEPVTWLALPAGRYNLPDGAVWEVGTLPLSGTAEWASVGFTEGFPGTPALFLTAQTANGSQPVTVRARAVDANGFQAALFEEDALMEGGHIEETVGYLAVYHPSGDGVADFGGAGAAPYSVGTASANHDFTPVLSGAFRVQVQEEQSLDDEVWHLPEQLSVMEIGGGILAQDITSNGQDTAALRHR